MKPSIPMLLILGLAACGGTSPDYWGIDATQITVGKSRFDVRIDGTRAQAIRRNVEWAPRLEAVAPRAMIAIEQVSGCEVTKLTGDAAVIEARLKCGAASALPPVLGWDCDIDSFDGRLTGGVAGMTCRPVR